MTPRIQEMLAGRDDVIDYAAVIKKFPWLMQKDQNCVLSPDSDGLLCGLFASHYLNWKIRGFYDGKIMVLEKGFKPKDCIFLDMEVFRKGIRSVGQHMVMFNKDRLPANWKNFDDCASINNIRGHDGYHDSRLNYAGACPRVVQLKSGLGILLIRSSASLQYSFEISIPI